MTILRFDDLKAVPWKNGLGITREIAVFPNGAGMDDFLWRASIADVDTASPFSVFPGIDRTIVLLEGDGFTMTLDGEREHALTEPCVPFAFAGEARVEVRLANGATRDFNLMVRRGEAEGDILVLRGPGTIDLDADIVLVYVAHGEGRANDRPIASGDTVFQPQGIELGEGTVALAIRLRPSRTGSAPTLR
ncbi:HutD family protein [Luteibacter aegosomatis]|uniref:HutD/Ves family protein n=1 Tax=Luteibacter aegosomatis TaxID=2911537 RepID=UPI001FF8D18B|nr:HutD family protein [Luteibacter aegosomatis]UPG86236.1 HutD family protein [Luteibacter aegosomatis]